LHQIPDHERGLYFRVDVGKSNNARPGAPVWRRIVGVGLANGDDVGVVEAWNAPGQGPDTAEKAAADALAEEVFMNLMRRFAIQGRVVSDKGGANFAPKLFISQPEAVSAKLSAYALKAAMDRLFYKGKIQSRLTGSGGRKHYELVLM
jgi:hypothetical protein